LFRGCIVIVVEFVPDVLDQDRLAQGGGQGQEFLDLLFGSLVDL
jgi:hypothetical protein